ncbi:hypothetical protein [Sphingomonas faeni]|uniref:hypothetical protein n=1 Tax=Sphingomonas faeni TaxID=185950 RepID=UPI002785CC48|nr:hypothetical protein [Sphingomonas faeni]MDQ0839001.1 putative repeat protein (TIGR01451 family) [Sphingomonas faeni]
MITRPMIAAVLATTAAVASAAAGPLQVTSSIMVEARSAAPDGTTRVTLVKPSRVTPGDKVIFILAYRNTGAQPLANVVLDNPLPRQIAYRSANPGSPAPDVSVDGKTFGSLATLPRPQPRRQHARGEPQRRHQRPVAPREPASSRFAGPVRVPGGPQMRPSFRLHT